MPMVQDTLIYWMHRMRIFQADANVVFRDLHMLSGKCERGEVVVMFEPHMLCVEGRREPAPARAGLHCLSLS